MVTFESVKIEYKTGAVFGALALVLSIAVGLAAGNTVLYTFGRALFLGIVFACLGTGLTMLLRKYVPEVFTSSEGSAGSSAFDEGASGTDFGASAGISAVDTSAPVSSSFDASSGVSGGAEEQGFVPLGEYVAGQQYGDEHLQTKGSVSVGRHILEEKGVKYEPKIIADAIRTMMSKDQ